MILIDFNQVMVSSVTSAWHKKHRFTEAEMMAIFLEKLRFYNKKFRDKYGKMVICCDDKNYWRRDIFPFYKAGRKIDRQTSNIDWPMIFQCMKKIKKDIQEKFPWPLIEVSRCEADDIISVLCDIGAASNEPIMIVSADQDMIQCHRYPGVKQFSPNKKKLITEEIDYHLWHKIVRGDSGDGIPNILSDDDVFVNTDKKQVRISKAMIEKWQKKGFGSPEIIEKFRRNETIIDLSKIPENYVNEIRNEWIKNKSVYETRGSNEIMNYLINNDLTQFIPELGDFL